VPSMAPWMGKDKPYHELTDRDIDRYVEYYIAAAVRIIPLLESNKGVIISCLSPRMHYKIILQLLNMYCTIIVSQENPSQPLLP
jgi:hypothetical protein